MTLVLDTPENLTKPVLGSEISREEFKKGTHDASFYTDIQTIYEMLRSQTLCRVQGRGDYEEENEEKEETASIQSFQLMVVHARWCECCSRVTCQSCLPEKNSFQAG